MPAAKSLKTSETTAILKKLVTELKKRYGGKTPKHSFTVLETLLYAACLEDTTYEAADEAYEKIKTEFFDLNEIRVSSVTEIESIFGDLHDAAWKSMRVRETLQHIFEKHFAFDLEQLKRKTQDAALKELKEIPFQTPFMRLYTLQAALSSHVLPLDTYMLQVLTWLGLADPKAKPEVIADNLKSAVKKSDAPLICALFKAVSVDPEIRWAFEAKLDEEPDPTQAVQRLTQLFKNPKEPKKKPEKKAAKTATKKETTSSKPTAAKKVKKKSTTAAKTVTKKKPVKKKTTKKSAPAKPVKKSKTATKVAKKKPVKNKTTKKKR